MPITSWATFLCLSVLICKMEVIVTVSMVRRTEQFNMCRVLRTALAESKSQVPVG